MLPTVVALLHPHRRPSPSLLRSPTPDLPPPPPDRRIYRAHAQPPPPPPELHGVHRGCSSPSPSAADLASPRSSGGRIWAPRCQIRHPRLGLAPGRRWSGPLASSGPPPPLSAADPSNPSFVHRRLYVPRVCRRPGYAAAARFESRLALFWLGRCRSWSRSPVVKVAKTLSVIVGTVWVVAPLPPSHQPIVWRCPSYVVPAIVCWVACSTCCSPRCHRT
jgi:hypothetical protein